MGQTIRGFESHSLRHSFRLFVFQRRMQQVVDFILEIDKLKGVSRKVRPLGQDRYENSAEHSWQIALLAASLAPYAESSVDIDRVIRMLLVHDIGEIDTGDTMVFVKAAGNNARQPSWRR